MLNLIKHLWLGVALIAAAAAVLLLSDLNRRKGHAGDRNARPRIAIMQFASTALLDDTVAGMLDRLREGGYDDRSAEIRQYNASGDYGTGTSMAHEIVGGGYSIILTASTPALQVMAAANRERQNIHVFGGVTDPYGSGVDITGPEPDQHPPHLVGVGTFQPVENAFAIAHAMRPELKRVGAVWNPAEHNSEACVLKAREKCDELGIELIEANAGNTSEVPDAVRSVLARGAEAIWIGGDTVATASVSAIISAARNAKVPVFTNDPTDVGKGALFGLGASYFEVGRAAADMAVQILQGADPATFRVENVVPERLGLDESVLDNLADEWIITDEMRERARTDAALAHTPSHQPSPGKTYKVGALYYMPDPIFDQTLDGFRDELAQLGFREGENLELTLAHANGDMSILPQVTRNLANSDIDLLVALATPCLSSAISVAKDKKIVFGIVTSPKHAGAGETFEDHLPNVTGAAWTAPHPDLFKWLRVLYPDARAMGVIHNPAEANSAFEVNVIRQECERLDMNLVVRTIAVSSDMPMAIQSLMAADVDVVFSIADNTAIQSLGALAEACRRQGVPLLGDDSSMMGNGVLYSCGASPVGEGRHTARLAARVLLGEDPADIPIEPSESVEIAVDLAAAKSLGVRFAPEMLARTDVFYNVKDRLERPLQVALVNSAHNDLLARAEAGLEQGLGASGLLRDEDYTLRRFNAEGDMTTMPQIVDAALALSPDLILTVSTPALMAVTRRAGDTPVVYTVASDPFAIGLFDQERPDNITGVHEEPPMAELLAMARRAVAELAVVGAVYDPSQPNSELAVACLREVCQDQDIRLVEATASTVSELPAATQSVVQRGARALLLSADNLVATGFPAIVKAARSADVPIFTTEPGQVEQGAAGAVGNDYTEWGVESGRMAAKVLAGLPPGEQPLQSLASRKVIEPQIAATAPAREASVAPDRPFVVRMVGYSNTHFTEVSRDGMIEGLRRAGLESGRDYDFKYHNAQGDMATLSSIMLAIMADVPDMILVISTPALQAALRQAGDRTIVFCSVADAVLAGAGKSETDHMPNVTGVTTRSPFNEMAVLIREVYPRASAVGTLFTPGEVNSVLYRDLLEEALRAQGVALISRPVNAAMETAEATISLVSEDIQAVCQIVDNTVRPGFAQITRRAGDAGLAVLSFDSATLAEGAALVMACDYFEAGVEAGALAAQILRGARPGDIPFRNTQGKALMINDEVVERLNLRLPESVRRQAKEAPEDAL